MWRPRLLWSKSLEWLSSRLGGPERARVIVLLALALGLDGADLGAVGSMSSILEHHFSITKIQIGYLICASKGIGVFSTLFFGSSVDRIRRIRLLTWVVLIWGAAQVLSGAVSSYIGLIIGRLILGAVAAATLPCVASLIGDYFPGSERGHIYGYVLAGELIGTGIGFICCGELAELWWRLGFWVLLLPSVPLAWAIHKLPEPQRGKGELPVRGQRKNDSEGKDRLLDRKIKEAGVQPRQRLVLDTDPAKKPIGWAVAFVLSIPTNLVLIIGSALGYAFFAAIRTFGIQYAQTVFHLKHTSSVGLLALVGIGALAGVWMGGRLGDGLLKKGHLKARVWVASAFFCLSVALFFLGFYFKFLWLSISFFVLSAFSMGGVNPPLDAARLDIIHPTLWGRAESVRIVFRDIGEAASPVGFGWLVANLGQGPDALREGFLLMLILLAIAAGLSFITFRTYLPDSAAAAAYREKTMDKKDDKSG